MLARIKAILKRVLYKPVIKVPVYVPTLVSELLKGRVALITGGTNGIGKAIARAYLSAGAKVIISGRSQEKINGVVEDLGENCQGVYLDALDVRSFKEKINQLPPFDILVNNAGVVGGGLIGSVVECDYDKVLDTNLKGSFFMAQEVSKKWIAEGVKGNILNICSTSSLRPGVSPYILSKWGMRSLTIGLAKSLIKHDIVVNGLAPGLTNTPQFVGIEGAIDNNKNPAGRLVTEAEVANMATILVSGIGRMVVGDIVYLGGGAGVVTVDDLK